MVLYIILRDIVHRYRYIEMDIPPLHCDVRDGILQAACRNNIHCVGIDILRQTYSQLKLFIHRNWWVVI